MSDEDSVSLFIARARETLAEAELLNRAGFRLGVVNRLYYACFYAVTALLHTDGLFSHKHSGVLSLFDRHWIKPGRLPVAMGRFFRRLFELRHQGDYASMVPLDEFQLSTLFDEARHFIDQVEQTIRSDTKDLPPEASQ